MSIHTVAGEAEAQNLSVFVRVKPLPSEIKVSEWRMDGRSVSQARHGCQKEYVLDQVFGEGTTTATVYQNTTAPIVKSIIDGFNCTVFAYGQTGSGKTHTMRGSTDDDGVISRAIADLFQCIAAQKDRDFLMRISYMELYNEVVNDLLDSNNTNLAIQGEQGSVKVVGLSEQLVYSVDEVLALMERGDSARKVAETKMNECSSRSHSIFRLVVESKAREASGSESVNGNVTDDESFAVKIGVMHLVDLAGSERVSKTGAEGLRLREGVNINKSLLTLGNVIKSLSEGKGTGRFIPYRDSKLTRILQPSLGGNARTVVICMITLAPEHADETHNTLEFATRAKKVINKVSAVETMSSAALIKRQASDIEDLKRKLAHDGNTDIAMKVADLQQKLLDNEKQREILEASKRHAENAKTFYERRNQDLVAENKRSANKRERFRRGTIAFGDRMPGAPDQDCDMMMTIQEDGEDTSTSCSDLDDLSDADGQPDIKLQKRTSHASMPASEPAGRMDTKSPIVISGHRHRPPDDVFGDELRGKLKTIKAELVQRDDKIEELRRQLDGSNEHTRAHEEAFEAMKIELEQERWRGRQAERELEELREQVASAEEAAAMAEEDAEQRQNTQCAELTAEREKTAHLESRLAAEADKTLKLHEMIEAALGRAEKGDHAMKLAKEREARILQERDAAKKQARGLQAELQEAQNAAQQTQEASEKRQSDFAALHEENERLVKHVADLESRKRPPLYQRKQEEELQAAKEHAAECQLRCVTAEASAKEIHAALRQLQQQHDALLEQVDEINSKHAEELMEKDESWKLEVKQLKESAATEHGVLQRDIEESQAKLQFAMEEIAQISSAQEQAAHASASRLEALQQELKDKATSFENAESFLRESEQARNALAARVDDLEAAAENAVKEQRLLQEQILAAADELEAAELRAKESAVQSAADLQATKEVHAQEIKHLHEEQHAAEQASAKHFTDALAAKQSEVNDLLSAVAKLQAVVDESAAAHKAHAELKELRIKSKREISDLQMQLKTANISNKGGDKAKMMLQKELEKAQKKHGELEVKLRSLTAEKMQAGTDKAAQERKVKGLESQVAKLGKELEKKEAVTGKRVEVVQEKLNHLQEAHAALEERLAKTKEEAAATQRSLSTSNEQMAALKAERNQLQTEAAATRLELHARQEELAATVNAQQQLQSDSAAAAEAAATRVAHLEASLSEVKEESAEARAQVLDLDEELDVLRKARAEMADALTAAQRDLASASETLKATQAARDKAMVNAEHLVEELRVVRASSSATEQQLKKRAAELENDLEDARAHIEALGDKLKHSESERVIMFQALEESEARVAELEGQARSAAGALAEARAAVERLRGERDRALQQLTSAEATAAERGNALTRARGELERESASHARAAGELERRELELRVAEERAADARRSADQHQLVASEQRTESVDRTRTLERDLAEARSAAAKAKSSALSAQQTCAEWQARCEELRTHYRENGESVGHTMDALRDDNRKLQHALNQEQEHMRRLEDELLRAREEHSLALQAAAEARDAARNAADAAQSCGTAADVRSLGRDLGRARGEIESLRSDLAQARVSGAALERDLADAAAASDARAAALQAQLVAASGPADDGRDATTQQLEVELAAARESAAALQAQLQEAAAGGADASRGAEHDALGQLRTRVAFLEGQLTDAQAAVDTAVQIAQKKAEGFYMQRRLVRKLDTMHKHLPKMLRKRHGVAEDAYAALVAEADAEYDRSYLEKKARSRAAQAASGQSERAARGVAPVTKAAADAAAATALAAGDPTPLRIALAPLNQ